MCWLDRILQDKWACRLWFVISHVLTICKVREKHRWCCYTRSYGLGHFNCSFTFFKVNDEWVNWLRHLPFQKKKKTVDCTVCTLPWTCQGFSRSPESICFQFIKHIFPHLKIKVAKSTLRWARKRLTPLFSAPRQCASPKKTSPKPCL